MTTKTVRESVLWTLRRGLEGAAEAQRSMVEKRIERAKEKEKSILYKAAGGSVAPAVSVGGGQYGLDDGDAGKTAAPIRSYDPDMDGAMAAEIESQLSPEQLQLFAEENNTLLTHYEDTLSKVQYVLGTVPFRMDDLTIDK